MSVEDESKGAVDSLANRWLWAYRAFLRNHSTEDSESTAPLHQHIVPASEFVDKEWGDRRVSRKEKKKFFETIEKLANKDAEATLCEHWKTSAIGPSGTNSAHDSWNKAHRKEFLELLVFFFFFFPHFFFNIRLLGAGS